MTQSRPTQLVEILKPYFFSEKYQRNGDSYKYFYDHDWDVSTYVVEIGKINLTAEHISACEPSSQCNMLAFVFSNKLYTNVVSNGTRANYYSVYRSDDSEEK